jgi:uncharacterized protein
MPPINAKLIYRVLKPGDEERLDSFLTKHADSSMFLRSNLRAAGLRYEGQRYQAVYAGMFSDGQIVGVAAHAWNNIVILQAAFDVKLLVCTLIELSRRPVKGVSGPWEQVNEARQALGLVDVQAALDGCEDLFALELSNLTIPQALSSGRITCRHPCVEDLETLISWRITYNVEAIGLSDTPELRNKSRSDIATLAEERNLWVLAEGDRLVSVSAFNSCLSDCVQIGGVYTPPELRGRGYARSAVAGSLLEAADSGVKRAVLFTDVDNAAARRAYESIGFERVGDYGLVLYDQPQQVSAGDSCPNNNSPA